MEDNTTVNPAEMPCNSQIRHTAYNALRGKWGYPVLATLLYAAVTLVAGNVPLASLLVICPLEFGFALLFLHLLRGQVSEGDIVTNPFNVFRDYGRYLGASLLVAVFTFLWMLLLIIPGCIKAYSYAMTSFVAYDNPELPVRECLRRSQRMMDGYKWKLFCLDLSFIGWALLCILTLGIGFLWPTPYINTAHAQFYLELKERDNN